MPARWSFGNLSQLDRQSWVLRPNSQPPRIVGDVPCSGECFEEWVGVAEMNGLEALAETMEMLVRHGARKGFDRAGTVFARIRGCGLRGGPCAPLWIASVLWAWCPSFGSEWGRGREEGHRSGVVTAHDPCGPVLVHDHREDDRYVGVLLRVTCIAIPSRLYFARVCATLTAFGWR
jgi:hypothetical protein